MVGRSISGTQKDVDTKSDSDRCVAMAADGLQLSTFRVSKDEPGRRWERHTISMRPPITLVKTFKIQETRACTDGKSEIIVSSDFPQILGRAIERVRPMYLIRNGMAELTFRAPKASANPMYNSSWLMHKPRGGVVVQDSKRGILSDAELRRAFIGLSRAVGAASRRANSSLLGSCATPPRAKTRAATILISDGRLRKRCRTSCAPLVPLVTSSMLPTRPIESNCI